MLGDNREWRGLQRTVESMLLKASRTLLHLCENMGPSCGWNFLFSREAPNLDFLCEISWFLNIGLNLVKILQARQNTSVGQIWPMVPVYKVSFMPYPEDVHLTCYNWDGFKTRLRWSLPLVSLLAQFPLLSWVWPERGEVCLENRPPPPTSAPSLGLCPVL